MESRSRLSRGREGRSEIRDRNVCRVASAHRQLALGGRSVLRARRQTTAEIRHGNLCAFQESADGSCSTRKSRSIDQNVLVIRIQPDEGISLRMQAKMPGTSLRIEPVKMDFHYGTSFGKASPEAYERLLLDAMSGDATLFARRDEVEEAWAFIDPIEKHGRQKNAPPLTFYPSGSWGPEEADELLARDGRAWRRL